MAYVAISGHLVERTQSIIRQMRRKEENSLVEFNENLTGIESFISDANWGSNLHLMTQMPKEWVGTTRRFRAIIEPATPENRNNETTHSFDLDAEVPVPPNHQGGVKHNVDLTLPIMQRAAEYYVKRREISSRWDKVENDVRGFLDKCKSLNEAVKLWPDVTMYIAPDDIERMGVKREKARESEALAALSQLDTDMLVGAVVISRMSQAAA